MPNELAVEINVEYADSITVARMNYPRTQFSPSAPAAVVLEQTVPTDAGGTALSLGGFAALGTCSIKNTDGANYIQLMTGVGGTVFARIGPGRCNVIDWEPTLTPAAIANTGAVKILIFSSSA